MKTLMLLASAILLSACSQFQARAYDPVEYNYAVMVASNTTHAVHRCISMADAEYNQYLQILNYDTFVLQEYESDKNDSTQTLLAANIIRDMTSTMLAHKTYTVAYCQHKLSNIQVSARTFARAVGNNNKYDMCQSDVGDRYKLFDASYKAGLITKEELSELAGDLLKLKDVDTSGCTLAERAKMAEALQIVQDAVSLGGL